MTVLLLLSLTLFPDQVSKTAGLQRGDVPDEDRLRPDEDSSTSDVPDLLLCFFFEAEEDAEDTEVEDLDADTLRGGGSISCVSPEKNPRILIH